MTISRDDALGRIRAWYSASTELAPDAVIGIHEFDLGYVGCVRDPEPEPEDPNSPHPPPASTGLPRIVIDRETGAASSWPCLPLAMVADMYVTHRSAETRFPAEVRAVLSASGWRPGRNVASSVNLWLAEADGSVRGITPPAPVPGFLAEFGKLILPTMGGSGQPRYQFHPAGRPGVRRHGAGIGPAATWFMVDTGRSVFPIGYQADDPAIELVMDHEAQVFLLDEAGGRVAGRGDEAIVNLVTGVPLPPVPPEDPR